MCIRDRLQKSQVTVRGLKKIRQLQQQSEAIPVKYRSLAVELIYREMQDRHSAAHFDGTMYLIRSTDEESKICIPEDYGWGDYVKTLQITKVPGDHLSIFHQPWLSGLQKAFQKVMEGDESA